MSPFLAGAFIFYIIVSVILIQILVERNRRTASQRDKYQILYELAEESGRYANASAQEEINRLRNVEPTDEEIEYVRKSLGY